MLNLCNHLIMVIIKAYFLVLVHVWTNKNINVKVH